MELQRSIQNQIVKISPKYKVEKLPKEFLQMVLEVADFIKHNQDVYKNREQYNIHWAFNHSQKMMNQYFNKFAVQRIQSKSKQFKSSNCTICDKFICKANQRRRNRLKRKIQTYSYTSLLITLLDILLAVIMVLAITRLKTVAEHLFTTGVLFAVLIAVTKVTLDKFWITPKVHSWGWKMFNKINSNFTKNISTALALLFILGELSKEDHQEEVALIIDSAERLLEK